MLTMCRVQLNFRTKTHPKVLEVFPWGKQPPTHALIEHPSSWSKII